MKGICLWEGALNSYHKNLNNNRKLKKKIFIKNDIGSKDGYSIMAQVIILSGRYSGRNSWVVVYVDF